MMIWFLFALLTVVAALAILVPLARGGRGGAEAATDGSAPDIAIYKDQLEEIDRDLERGVIEPGEAEAARTEIARRLLKAARLDEARGARAPGVGRRRVAVGVAVGVVPALALGTYLSLGSPQLADAPLAARQAENQAQTQIEELVARVEQHLAAEPEDGRGWEVIAPVYMRVGRPEDAVKAYANALRLLGETARRQADLGEAIVVSANGVVTSQARAAFERAVALEADSVKPRFYLAMALGQEGKHEEAIAAWNQLLAGARGDEPWVPAVRGELAKLGVDPAPQPPVAGLPGPSAADMEAAGQMDAGDRQAMIEGMVAQLDERLREGGGSLDEWTRLVRAYMVLDRRDAAAEALARAKANLAGDAESLSRLDALASQFGLQS